MAPGSPHRHGPGCAGAPWRRTARRRGAQAGPGPSWAHLWRTAPPDACPPAERPPTGRATARSQHAAARSPRALPLRRRPPARHADDPHDPTQYPNDMPADDPPTVRFPASERNPAATRDEPDRARPPLTPYLVVRWRRGSRAAIGVDDDELAHHSAVLVFEQVTVEHVGRFRVGVVAEVRREACRLPGRDQNGVFEAAQFGGRRISRELDDPEADVVDVEAVRDSAAVLHL